MGKPSTFIRALALATALEQSTALASSDWTPASPPLAQVSTVYQFSHPLWLENINQRPNGLIVATELTAPNVWQFDPAQPATQTPVVAATIPNKTSLLGITEYAPDVFAVVAGVQNPDQSFSGWSVWTVDLTSSPSKTSLLANFPAAGLLNGMTYVPSTHPHSKSGGGIILVADSALGQIWSLDLSTPTPTPSVAAKDPLMVPCATAIPQGINRHKNTAPTPVYFTNTFCQGGYAASLPIDPSTGKSAGAAQIVGGPNAQQPRIALDDLAINPAQHVAYAASGSTDQIRAIDLVSGSVRPVAGHPNTTEIAQPTGVWIGRTPDDKKHGRVYISTAGGLSEPINGTVVVGGQVLAIDLGGWY